MSTICSTVYFAFFGPSFTNFNGELATRLCEFGFCCNSVRPSFTKVDEGLTKRLCETGSYRGSRRPSFTNINEEYASRLCEFGVSRTTRRPSFTIVDGELTRTLCETLPGSRASPKPQDFVTVVSDSAGRVHQVECVRVLELLLSDVHLGQLILVPAKIRMAFHQKPLQFAHFFLQYAHCTTPLRAIETKPAQDTPDTKHCKRTRDHL